jgi:hypothetical protein
MSSYDRVVSDISFMESDINVKRLNMSEIFDEIVCFMKANNETFIHMYHFKILQSYRGESEEDLHQCIKYFTKELGLFSLRVAELKDSSNPQDIDVFSKEDSRTILHSYSISNNPKSWWRNVNPRLVMVLYASEEMIEIINESNIKHCLN